MNDNNSKKYSFYFKGEKAAVLLVHGITGTPSEMRYFGRSLYKAGYSVLCNTLPRHCDSLNELKKVTWQEIIDSCIADLNFLKREHSKVFVAGLSMGALVGIHLAYKFPCEISGIIGLAPTLFYDGWATYSGKILLPIVWHIPIIRNNINIREEWPYGLKDEILREKIHKTYAKPNAGKFDNDVALFGSPFFPMVCLYQHHLFAKVVKKEIPSVKTPIIIMHAKEDDMTSPKNAQYIFERIGSANKSLVILENSYHMITIDQERDKVADIAINFLNSL
ncbi:MAG: alpha/beta fold hydrolase [Candidatus Omnitrophota bacterium]|nr:alpha/beta fold hydrolase [Candidatus Omnitrophota bacterium]